MEKEDNIDHNIQVIKMEEEKFIYHINEIENLSSEYNIEDMGNDSPEQEYIMYIEECCRELREMINKLYRAKLYIIKNDLNNKTEFYRHKIGI
jgi:hypothetical protein